jgi:poly-gamma-glutamate synthesis protein (capsule biosynthesis protein)
VNLDPGQLGALRSSFDAPWTGVRDLFLSDDLTIVNLECAAARGGERQRKEFTFRCDPDALPAMRDAGVEIANLGNNHSGDFGPQALLDSRANLIAARIVPVGAGRDATEANGPVTFSMKGHKVAVLGFGGVVPAPGWIAGANHPGVADGYSTASMVSAVRAAAAQADFVFVTLHWGEELDTQPRADDVARAHALVDAGANAIFGHHAHRLQPLQWYAGRPIFFGLGNFVWPTGGSTAVAEVVVRPDGGMQACLLPARISGGRPALTGAGACT